MTPLFINDVTKDFGERFRAARLMLIKDDKGNGDQAAAKAWLTYRALEGHMKFNEWLNWVAIIQPVVEHRGFALRWQMSQTMAEAYFCFIDGKTDRAVETTAAAIALWKDTEIATAWPAQIVNYLRAQCMMIYREFLLGQKDTEIRLMIDGAFQQWRNHIATIDFWKHPLRLSEMHDDRIVLQMLVYIGRGVGAWERELPRMEWANEDNIIPTGPTRLGKVADPFYAIIKGMESLNPERAIWHP